MALGRDGGCSACEPCKSCGPSGPCAPWWAVQIVFSLMHGAHFERGKGKGVQRVRAMQIVRAERAVRAVVGGENRALA